jgi:hypothetical protein
MGQATSLSPGSGCSIQQALATRDAKACGRGWRVCLTWIESDSLLVSYINLANEQNLEADDAQGFSSNAAHGAGNAGQSASHEAICTEGIGTHCETNLYACTTDGGTCLSAGCATCYLGELLVGQFDLIFNDFGFFREIEHSVKQPFRFLDICNHLSKDSYSAGVGKISVLSSRHHVDGPTCLPAYR